MCTLGGLWEEVAMEEVGYPKGGAVRAAGLELGAPLALDHEDLLGVTPKSTSFKQMRELRL